MILFSLSFPTFLFDFFLVARAEILTKISLVFLVDTKSTFRNYLLEKFDSGAPAVGFMTAKQFGNEKKI